MDYRTYKVKENRELADDLFLLEFEGILETKPGQFVFAWIPEKGEKPFSVFDDDPLTLLVQKRGCFTEHLSRLGKGDSLYIRGPYGNSPEVGENCLLVSGGTGVAALYLFAKRNPKSTVVVGAKDKVRLVCEKLSGACKEIHISTESGEVGRKGRVTDTLEDILRKVKPDSCVNCGPEPMVRAAVRIEEKYVVPDRIYSSVERVTKCGIGLCGSCATSKGYRSCVDGTFFAEEKI